MTKWEYYQDHGYGPMSIERMNSLGKQGWEFVNLIVVKEAFGHATVHIFKRPIIENPK